MAATSTVLHAIYGQPRVHILLINEATGLFWPALFQSLAGQPELPPLRVKVTILNFRFLPGCPHNPLGWLPAQQLKEEAARAGIRVECRVIHATCDAYDPAAVAVEKDEAVAVLSSWSMMLFPDEKVLPSNPRNSMLRVSCNMHC
jgi:hypothetical protein